MIFREEVDGALTGAEIKNSEELKGAMRDSQIEYFARKFASEAMDTADRRGYGIGEVGFYIIRDCGELVEFDLATNAEATEIRNKAEDLMWEADDKGMTINHSYNSFFEDERRVEQPVAA